MYGQKFSCQKNYSLSWYLIHWFLQYCCFQKQLHDKTQPEKVQEVSEQSLVNFYVSRKHIGEILTGFLWFLSQFNNVLILIHKFIWINWIGGWIGNFEAKSKKIRTTILSSTETEAVTKKLVFLDQCMHANAC